MADETRVETLVRRANDAEDVATFQQIYRDARDANVAVAFSDDEKAALAAAFNAAVVRLTAL